MSSCLMVIEDERDISDVVCLTLELEGYVATCVGRPEVALNVVHDLHPDLFLIDLMLPGMSGIELAAQLRMRGFSTTPMLALSASPQLLAVARDSHLFQATIAKPYSLSELLEQISAHLAA